MFGKDTVKSYPKVIIIILILAISFHSVKWVNAAEENEKIQSVLIGKQQDIKLGKLYTIKLPKDIREIIIPVTVGEKGTAIPVFVLDGEVTTGVPLTMTWYLDKKCKKQIDKFTSIPEKGIYTGYLKTPKKALYYLKLNVDDNVVEDITLKGTVQLIRGNDRMVPNQGQILLSVEKGNPLYLQVKVKTAGKLKVKVAGYDMQRQGKMKMVLCNSKKVERTPAIWLKGNMESVTGDFAVAKGTYYLKITAGFTTNNGCFRLYADFTKNNKILSK